ncbi:MAG: DUF4363 family protein [Clostridia bacterium]|nr:DUF4363 family protein [Clostridia bacterium]
MKRLIIISLVTLFVVALGVVESVYSTNLFENLENQLTVIDKCLDDDKENISSDDVVKKVDELINEWDGVRNVVITFSNHGIVRSLEEKLYALQSSIKTNEYVNAKEYATLARALSRDLVDETYITIGNLF